MKQLKQFSKHKKTNNQNLLMNCIFYKISNLIKNLKTSKFNLVNEIMITFEFGFEKRNTNFVVRLSEFGIRDL